MFQKTLACRPSLLMCIFGKTILHFAGSVYVGKMCVILQDHSKKDNVHVCISSGKINQHEKQTVGQEYVLLMCAGASNMAAVVLNQDNGILEK